MVPTCEALLSQPCVLSCSQMRPEQYVQPHQPILKRHLHSEGFKVLGSCQVWLQHNFDSLLSSQAGLAGRADFHRYTAWPEALVCLGYSASPFPSLGAQPLLQALPGAPVHQAPLEPAPRPCLLAIPGHEDVCCQSSLHGALL